MIEPDVQTASVSDADMALTWESIGRFVRRETLDVVSSHFAAKAVAERELMSHGQVSRPEATDGSDAASGGAR